MREAVPVRRSRASRKMTLPKARASEILAGLSISQAERRYVQRVLASVQEEGIRKLKPKGGLVEDVVDDYGTEKMKPKALASTPKRATRKLKPKGQTQVKRTRGK